MVLEETLSVYKRFNTTHAQSHSPPQPPAESSTLINTLYFYCVCVQKVYEGGWWGGNNQERSNQWRMSTSLIIPRTPMDTIVSLFVCVCVCVCVCVSVCVQSAGEPPWTLSMTRQSVDEHINPPHQHVTHEHTHSRHLSLKEKDATLLLLWQSFILFLEIKTVFWFYTHQNPETVKKYIFLVILRLKIKSF